MTSKIGLFFGERSNLGSTDTWELLTNLHIDYPRAANDPGLMRRIGQVTAVEMAATSVCWNYGSAVSLPQDVRWGRTYEG